MAEFGQFYPVVRDEEGLLAATCQNVSAKVGPDAPVFTLITSNPSTDLWQDEDGGLIQEGNGDGIILE
jgi:hypothetical protein